MTALGWALLAVVVLALALYGVRLKRGVKEGFSVGELATRIKALPMKEIDTEIAIMLIGVEGLGLAVGLSIWLGQIGTGYGMQILMLGVLVLVTMWYGAHTKRMANEMREQRYDAVRPVIDFERRAGGDELIGEALAAKQEEFSYGVWCILRNIGVGPATDVCSLIVNPIDGKCQLWAFGTLATKDYTEKMRFYPQQRGDRWMLVAYYKDVHGRCFESSREVSKDTERGGWKTGPPKTEVLKIVKEELP